jgi:polysaccharide export outer membrane protein
MNAHRHVIASPRCQALAALALALSLPLAGCSSFRQESGSAAASAVMEPPRELAKVSLPIYRIEPPDVVQIEILKVVPLPPYRIESLDVLQITALGTLPDQPIAGYFLVDAEGAVDLGLAYGSVRVAGLSIHEARVAIETQLHKVLKAPEISVQLARSASIPSVSGNYLVASDGTINLRQYGLVRVSGMTLADARAAIERQLSVFFDAPKVSLDVVAYNSKVYYIVTEGAGAGDNIVRVPITGNETVLDALSQVHGLSQMSSKKIWIARPAPYDFQCEQILPVDYDAVTKGASVATNYQLLPGDRLFVAEDRNMALAAFLGKVISPFERVAGFAGLTASTIRNYTVPFNSTSGGGVF